VVDFRAVAAPVPDQDPCRIFQMVEAPI
jgi:hypothetical protein